MFQIRNLTLRSQSLPKNLTFFHLRSIFIRPAPDHIPELTNLQIIEDFSADVGVQLEYDKKIIKNSIENRRKLMDLLPRDRNELPPRKMQDSFVSAVIPLGRDPAMRERYVTYFGTARIGRILEDLDVFAAWTCYKHILNPRAQGHQNPYSVVTALVDSIHFPDDNTDRIRINEDLRVSGHVSYVGKSSMEVSVLVDQKDTEGDWIKVTEALFVMVARDPMNQGAALINPLIAETPEEKEYIHRGEVRNLRRKINTGDCTTKVPTGPEIEEIHKLFVDKVDPNCLSRSRSQVVESEYRMMSDSKLNTLLLCHPQYRNRFNKIFGGFIMRQAFEIAFANVYLYAKSRPKILDIDDIHFKLPVEIGALLCFTATVGYVEGKYVHMPVIAEVIDPKTGERNVTNIFRFTFHCLKDAPQLQPNTYLEALQYLESKRRFKEMMKQTSSPNYY